MALLSEETEKRILYLVDLEKQDTIASMQIGLFSICDHLADSAFVVYDSGKGVQVIDITPQKRKKITLPKLSGITRMATYQCKDKSIEKYLLTFGHENGLVSVFTITIKKFNKWAIERLFSEKLHDKAVNDIVIVNEEQVISAGFDKKLILTDISKGNIKSEGKEFKISVQCEGMKVDYVIPDNKRKLLETFIKRAKTAKTQRDQGYSGR
jgi:WD40 repeat protein